jgi:hypothetical protein
MLAVSFCLVLAILWLKPPKLRLPALGNLPFKGPEARWLLRQLAQPQLQFPAQLPMSARLVSCLRQPPLVAGLR